jgi:hypothetical protein
MLMVLNKSDLKEFYFVGFLRQNKIDSRVLVEEWRHFRYLPGVQIKNLFKKFTLK